MEMLVKAVCCIQREFFNVRTVKHIVGIYPLRQKRNFHGRCLFNQIIWYFNIFQGHATKASLSHLVAEGKSRLQSILLHCTSC